MRPEDIQIVQLGSSPAMFASLEKGGIDGAVFTIPTFFVAEDLGYKTLADPIEMGIYYLQNSVDTKKSYLRNQHDVAVRFIKGICEGIAYFEKHKKESIAVLQKKLRIQSAQEKDIKYLEASYDLLANNFITEFPSQTQRQSRRLWNSSPPKSPRHEEPTQKCSSTKALFAKSKQAGLSRSFMKIELGIA
jgi:ABC-type nitrate/sulfonate/bicarbonate transport system substrate-binding protein